MTKNRKRKLRTPRALTVADAEFIARALYLYAHNYCPNQIAPTPHINPRTIAAARAWDREARKSLALVAELRSLALQAQW